MEEAFPDAVDAENVKINVDNESALKMLRNPKLEGRTKHMSVRIKFLQDETMQRSIKSIRIEYVPTENNRADIYTKPVPAPTLNKLISVSEEWPTINWEEHFGF
jgi:hypothetical protein